jgi:glycyl-tRNA synthetase beta chain
MSELLLELMSEEIPARMQVRAAEDLKRLVTGGLAAAGLEIGQAMAFATPRRLILVVEDVPALSPAVSEERKGPRLGAPQAAIDGFLKAAGLASLDQAEIATDPKKGEYYVARSDKPGRAATDIIREVVTKAVATFPWPKSMRWGSGDLVWVRPLQSIVCLYAGAVVPFEISGLRSGSTTRGHRFHGNTPFEVKAFKDYATKLKGAQVLLPTSERILMIREQAETLAKAEKLTLVEDPGLLDENAGLTEWPVVMMGAFDKAFLDVPAECLTTAMRTHQKCFSLKDAKGQKLVNRFLLVSNLTAPDGGKTIVAGNEKVIRARLSDAKFFWEQDLKRRLEPMHFELKSITFHEKLGTQWDRMERITELARQIAGAVDAEPELAGRAAQLAKADLVSGMVGEFPELQGLMGRYYAEAEHMNPKIAAAIEEHYKPKGQSDTVPTAPVSVAVALADKLDMLVGFWAIGEKPTGSGDPYQLRRAALGVIRIILENDLRLPLLDVFETANDLIRQRAEDTVSDLNIYRMTAISASEAHEILADHYKAANPYEFGDGDPEDTNETTNRRIESTTAAIDDAEENDLVTIESIYSLDDLEPDELDEGLILVTSIALDDDWPHIRSDIVAASVPINRVRAAAALSTDTKDLLTFFHDRLKVYLRDKGARHDLIEAVLSAGAQDDLALIVKRVEALDAFLKSDDGANLVAGVKRASNILAIEEKKDKAKVVGVPDGNLLQMPEERALFAAIEKAKFDTTAAINVENFAGAMNALADLRGPVDQFFDKVTVNVDDAALRANRLRLLAEIRAATLKVADLSKVAGGQA